MGSARPTRSGAARTSMPPASWSSSRACSSASCRASSTACRCWTSATSRTRTKGTASHRRRRSRAVSVDALSYNVASLLRSAPGTERRYPVDDVRMDIAEDVTLAEPITGEVRLSHTGRSVLARAHLTTAIEGTCSRCLKVVVAPIEVKVEEEALPSIDIDTGVPVDVDAEPDALRLDDHHQLDLAEPVREAISLAELITLLCRDECRGLCPTCGIDLNAVTDHSHNEEAIDPRLAALAEWRDTA